MSNTLALSVVLGGALGAGFNSTFNKAGGKIGQLARELGQTRAQAKKVAGYETLEATLGKTRLRLQKTRKDALTLRKELGHGPDNTALGKKLAHAEKQSGKLSSALEKQKEKLRKAGMELRKDGIDTKHLASESERLKAAVSRQTSAWQKQSAVLEKRRALGAAMRGQLLKLGGAILIGKKAVGHAVEFESAMADVRKVVDFDSPQQFKQMGQDIDAMSRKLPMARDNIAAIVAAGGQAGIARDDLVAFATDAVKMGVAFDMSADDAGTMMAKWRTGLNLTQAQAASLGDVVNQLSNSMAATPVEIGTIVKEVGPFAKSAGLSAENVAALGASMVAMGAESSVAGTSLRRMLINLSAGDAAAASQQEAFKKLGLTSKGVAQSMQRDAKGTIVNVLKQIKTLPKDEQASIITQLFGAHAVQAVAPLLNNMDALKTALHDAGDESVYAGSMQKEYLSRVTTTANALQLGKNAWTSITGVIGKVFLPTIKVVVGQFISFANVFVAVANKFPNLTAAVTAATVAFLSWKTVVIGGRWLATFLPGLGKMGTLLKALVPGAGLAQKAILGIAGAMKAFNLSFLLSPVGLILAGIGVALIGVALIVRKYWQPISAFMTGVWQGIKEAAGPALGAIGDALAPLKPLWDGFVSILAKVWDWFGKLLKPVKSTQSELDGATSAGKAFGRAWVTAFKIVTFPIRMVIKLVVGLGKIIGETAGWIAVHMGRTADAVGSAWDGAIHFVQGLWQGLKAVVGTVVDWITGKIDWIVKKWQGVKSAVGGVWNKVTGGRDEGEGTKPKLGRSVAAGVMLGASFMTPAMAAQPQNQPPVRAMRGAAVQQTNTSTTTVQVHAAPGMNEAALAREVRRELDKRDRELAARHRSALKDLD